MKKKGLSSDRPFLLWLQQAHYSFVVQGRSFTNLLMDFPELLCVILTIASLPH